MTTGPCRGAPRGRFLVLDCGGLLILITTVFGAFSAPPCAWIDAPRRFCLARQLQGAGGHPAPTVGIWRNGRRGGDAWPRHHVKRILVVEFLPTLTGERGWLF